MASVDLPSVAIGSGLTLAASVVVAFVSHWLTLRREQRMRKLNAYYEHQQWWAEHRMRKLEEIVEGVCEIRFFIYKIKNTSVGLTAEQLEARIQRRDELQSKLMARAAAINDEGMRGCVEDVFDAAAEASRSIVKKGDPAADAALRKLSEALAATVERASALTSEIAQASDPSSSATRPAMSSRLSS